MHSRRREAIVKGKNIPVKKVFYDTRQSGSLCPPCTSPVFSAAEFDSLVLYASRITKQYRACKDGSIDPEDEEDEDKEEEEEEEQEKEKEEKNTKQNKTGIAAGKKRTFNRHCKES
jgi:hypothetical protein